MDPEDFHKQYTTFLTQTLPVRDYYLASGIGVSIDATRTPDEIFNLVAAAMKQLEADRCDAPPCLVGQERNGGCRQEQACSFPCLEGEEGGQHASGHPRTNTRIVCCPFLPCDSISDFPMSLWTDSIVPPPYNREKEIAEEEQAAEAEEEEGEEEEEEEDASYPAAVE